MIIGGKEYPVIGYVKSDVVPYDVPLVDIPMMSDERWNELARQNAVENYIREFGKAPENTEDAVRWQRARADQLVKEATV